MDLGKMFTNVVNQQLDNPCDLSDNTTNENEGEDDEID